MWRVGRKEDTGDPAEDRENAPQVEALREWNETGPGGKTDEDAGTTDNPDNRWMTANAQKRPDDTSQRNAGLAEG